MLAVLLLCCVFASVLAAPHPLNSVGIYTTAKPKECTRQSKNGDSILVHYTGHLETIDGYKFDSSLDRGEPIGFTLGSGQVIQGWDQGLQNMCIGEKRVLTIPPQFGYGYRTVGDIPAGSTLVFSTELVGFDDTPPLMDRVEDAATAFGSDIASRFRALLTA